MSDRRVQASRSSYASQCEGKVAFASPRLAEEAAKRRTGRIIYRCRYCHEWHVGTPDPRPKVYEKRNKLIRLFLHTEFVDE